MIGVLIIHNFNKKIEICYKQLDTLFDIYSSFYEVPSLKDVFSIAFELYQARHKTNLSIHKERFINLMELKYISNLLLSTIQLPTNSNDIILNFNYLYGSIINYSERIDGDFTYLEMMDLLFNKGEIKKITDLKNLIPVELVENNPRKDGNKISIIDYLKKIDEIYNPLIMNFNLSCLHCIVKLFILENMFSHMNICHGLEYNDKHSMDLYDWDQNSTEFYFNIFPYTYQLIPLLLARFSKDQVRQLIRSSIINQANKTSKYFSISKSKVSYSNKDYLKLFEKRNDIFLKFHLNGENLIKGLEINKDLSNVQAVVDSVFHKINKMSNTSYDEYKKSVNLNCVYQFLISYKIANETKHNLDLVSFDDFDLTSNSKRRDHKECVEQFDRFCKFIDERDYFPYIFNYFNYEQDKMKMTNFELAFSLTCFDHNLFVNENNRSKSNVPLSKSELYLHLDDNFVGIKLTNLDKKIINYLYSSQIKPYLEKKNNIYTIDNPRALSLYRIVNEQLVKIIEFKSKNGTLKSFYESTHKKISKE